MIEVGEYIRSYDGYMGKIVEIRKAKRDCDTYYKTDKSMANGYYEHIKAHSKNIIDLIEENDIVNGEKVITIDHNKGKIGICIPVDDYACATELSRIHIKTILTHELYEQDSYKVVE